jgi:hypothetical protein
MTIISKLNPFRRRFLTQTPALAALPFISAALPQTASSHTTPAAIKNLPVSEVITELEAVTQASVPSFLDAALEFARQNPLTRYEQALLAGPGGAFLKDPVRFARQIAAATDETIHPALFGHLRQSALAKSPPQEVEEVTEEAAREAAALKARE